MNTTSPSTAKPGKVGTGKALRQILSIPFIWGMLPVTVLMHLGIFVYQAICFRLYGIPRVQLRSYLNFDREKLSYLSNLDKFNCAYCSYSNAVFGWTAEVGHRTEFYWCGVKHRNQPTNPAFAYQAKFAEYGSKEEYDQILLASGRRQKC